MRDYVFPPPSQSAVAVVGRTEHFPVHRVFCVGRNYAGHIREMGFDPAREAPFFFMKPASAVVANHAMIPYPAQTQNLEHEIELVAAIGSRGSDIPVETALDHVFGYGVGVDLTRRDVQVEARKQGRPWEAGKSFDRSAPLSPLRRAADVGHLGAGEIWLRVNDELRQSSNLANLIWSVSEIISNLSRYWDLMPGDLIFTGTPEGVGAIRPGDVVRGGVAGLSDVVFTVSGRERA